MALSATTSGLLRQRPSARVQAAPTPAKPARPILRLAPKAEPPPEPTKPKGPAFTPRKKGNKADRRRAANQQRYEPAWQLLALFAERWPAVFGATPKPLAIGIHHAILAAMPEVDPKTLTVAFRFHVDRWAYRQASIAGATRFDLDGNPAGEVTADEAARLPRPRGAP